MNPNRADTNELLKKLANSASWWRRFFESSDAEEIHQIISELSSLDLAALDQRVRESWTAYRYYNLQNWQALRPSDVDRLAQSKFATSLIGLASFHFNGYVREAAVVELASQRTGKELPFLLIRLNDWVSQVRDAAASAVRARIEPAYAVHLLANISLVLRLRVCGRVEKKFVDDICDLLKGAECKNILLAGTTSKDKAVRRISFHLAAEAEPSTRAAIIRAAMTDPDAVARAWAARHFLPDVSPEELPGVIEPMLKDRFMPVRQDALWYAATKRPDIAKQPLRSALLDDHVSMREIARQFLAAAAVESAREFYAAAVESNNEEQRFAAICGLGETGIPADVPLVLPFLGSPITKIRRAAAYALGRLDVEGQLSRLVSVLSDVKPSVSREALKALQSKARYISSSDLENLFANAGDAHVRRNALSLILHTDKWKKIPLLLEASADKDARIAEKAGVALKAWVSNYNSSFAEPTRDDFEKISSALSQVESRLPHGFAAELRSCLKMYFK
jgi:HEAT repeat protein